MNPEPATHPPEAESPSPQIATQTPPPAPNSDESGEPVTPTPRRRTGKVAQLSKEKRDTINTMLLDGATYSAIIEKFADQDISLNHENLSNWKDGGYQDWLAEQQWREEMNARQESFVDLFQQIDPSQLPFAGLQIGIMQLCEQLRDLRPGARKEQVEQDADKYLRLLNTLARLSKGLLGLQKYREDTAATKSKELKRLNVNRDLEDLEREALLDVADNLFGFKSAKRLELERTADACLAEAGRRQVPSASTPAPPQSPPSPSNTPEPLAPICLPDTDHQPLTTDHQPLTQSEEHCLECHDPLPPLLPDGARPNAFCPSCGVRLPSPGVCRQPCIERCCFCHAALPQPYPDRCHVCGEALSAPVPAPPCPPEHCLECGALLPALQSDGMRPGTHCPNCSVRLPPSPGVCRLPSIERCWNCNAALPHPEPNGGRISVRCQVCGCDLPDEVPTEPQPQTTNH